MKKIISITSMIFSIILILLSIEQITMVGLLEGKCTIYQSILTSEKTFDLVMNGVRTNNISFIFMFFVAIALLFVPCFILFNQSKARSIICIVINTIGTIGIFAFFNSCRFMYLMIIVCLMILSNTLVCSIRSYKSGFNWFIAVISVLIIFANVYYLISHLQMSEYWDNGILNGNIDTVVEGMVEISRVNIICFCLWLIPSILLLCKEFMIKRKEEV